ncbi:photosystem reaction center subunit H [Deinococcus cavernae]|uniref:Photosystem reaction center subunit H n=1 Tax=Deinococcus cavernae TaxID=2320857 RepID=A0A418V5P4_9DEIO|nr:PRC-barrel domain-containing protein [Deinococcus cavernae]RJF71387.1 photosystem reaction center subunit H [Deinococcus cavernae]
MIKGKEILGRNIVAISTGEKVDSVRDVVFDHQGNQVLAFLVDEGGWFRAAKAVPFERVRSIGEHAIMIASADDVTSSRDDGRLADALESKTSLLGMTLLTTDGQNLGKIADVYFDENTGRVVGYEATGGLFADLSSGRAFIPAPSDVQIGADAAIVPLSVAAAMKENPGGLKGAIKTAGDAVTGAVHHTGETVTGAVQSAGEAVKDTYQSAASSVKETVGNASEAVTERQQEYVIGKTSNTEIVAGDGTVIVHEGEVVTPLHAEVAEWHGKLPALAAAVTGAGVSTSLGQATESFTSKMTAGFRDLLGETRARQKHYVVGKTAGQDIELENGLFIAHKGDTITAAQAEAAEKAGKLAALTAAATGGAVADAYDDARTRVQESYAEIREATADRQKAYVTGKVAGTNVVSDSGEVIVSRGVTIGAHHAERAEATGSLAALTAAATAGAVTGAGQDDMEDNTASPHRIEDTLGRRVRHDIRAPGGSLLAAQGQIVNTDIAARAQTLGLEQLLIEATLGEEVQGSNAAAANLLDRAKSWFSDRKEETEQAMRQREQEAHEQRIRSALGRPVTRVILAPDDSIILNTGEIITNKAVDAARAGNVLDILLDSVSKEDPSIDPLATRPTETGQAALESQQKPDAES